MQVNVSTNSVIIILFFWIPGVVLAQGFWSTLASTLFAPYAAYLVAEKLMQLSGII